MIRGLIGAEIGRRLAGRNSGVKGALIGAAAPWLLRRAFTPFGLAVGGVIAAKTLYDMKKERDRNRTRLDNGAAPAQLEDETTTPPAA